MFKIDNKVIKMRADEQVIDFQKTNTCSKSMIEALEECVEYIQK